MSITMPLDSEAARRLLGDLGRAFAAFPGELEKVLVMALNKTLVGSRTQAVRLITGRYAVKAGEVKRKLVERKASRNSLYIRLSATGRPILLSRFNARRKDVKGKRSAYTYQRGGATVSVGASGPRKYRAVEVQVLKSGRRKLVKGAFSGKPKNGVEMIFKGKGEGKKLEVLRGPSLFSFLAQPQVKNLILATATERLERELRTAAAHRLSKLVK